ncbi:LOW QUALITY PROTEIN: glutamate-rich protein 6 [Melospiza georgiana]|nr:LOW QUALITY PROTEIN: glutamate-rich protein 6 [Melospiza georgiana]
MDGPGRAAEPSGRADDAAGGPRWSPAPEEGAEPLAEPQCETPPETPPAGPQPTPPPTVLPTLLAYRPESSEANVHHEAEEDAEPTCEYCGNLLRPFPFSQDVPLSEDQEDKFCCKRSRELYEFIMKEKKRLEDASSLPRAVSTQESLSAEANLLLSKEQDSQRQQKRHLARELADQSLRLSATKGLQQAGSASYKPSQERTSPKGRTPAPPASAAKHEPWAKEKHKLEPEPWAKDKHKLELEPWPDEMPELESQPKEEPELESQPKEKPELEPRPEEELEEEPQPEEESELELWPEEEPELENEAELENEPKSQPEEEPESKKEPKHDKKPASRSVLCYEFSLLGKKVGKGKLVQKYYKNGKKFLTMLPDGTSQLFYPSGNLAIIIAQATDQLMCIVQEDEPRTAKIRALFQSDGRSTCYYPSGDEWINMSMQGGQYLDQAGNRVRRWMWPNLLPEPQVPLSPIFISLNHYVGVRILAQDKIFVSFLAMGRQAKLNMGTKVQVSTDSQLPPPARLGEDELLLLAFRVKILQLFDRMRGCLTFPSSEQWNKMQPPMYLISQAVKILELSVTADISDELANSIKAIVNAQ